MIWWLLAAGLIALLMLNRPAVAVRPGPAARPRARLPQQILHPGRLPGVRGDSLWRLRPDPHCANTRERMGQHVLAREAIDLADLGCDVTACRCTWRPTPDRRRGERRRGESAHVGSERRGPDRRRG